MTEGVDWQARKDALTLIRSLYLVTEADELENQDAIELSMESVRIERSTPMDRLLLEVAWMACGFFLEGVPEDEVLPILDSMFESLVQEEKDDL